MAAMNRMSMAQQLNEQIDGESILDGILGEVANSKSAFSGVGAEVAAASLAKSKRATDESRAKGLVARKNASNVVKEAFTDPNASDTRDLFSLMKADETNNKAELDADREARIIKANAAINASKNRVVSEQDRTFLNTGKIGPRGAVLDVPYVESGIRDDAPITYSGDQAAGASGRTAAIDAALREALGEDEEEGTLSPDDMPITRANTDFPSRIGMDLNDNTDGKPKGLMSKPYDADRMKDANITADTGNTIIASSYLKDNSIAENGVFSQDALETAVSNTTDNNTFNAMLLGNIAKETGGGGPKTETGYGRLTGAQAATDKRTKGRGTGPEATARNAAYIALDSNPDFINGDFDQKSAMIFDIFYDDDNRAVGLKLGNTQPGDGSLFKGRGLVQITGRENYKLVQDQLAKSGIEVDFMANPDLINDPKYSLPAAVAFLELKGINKNNINELGPYKMSRLINAGEGSTEALDRWSEVTGLLTGTDAQNATDTNEKTAQTTAGITGNYPNTNISKIDGNIGAGSVTAFKAYLVAQGITIPKGASKYDLVRLVNQS